VTDLERFAAVLLAEWQAASGRAESALAVGGLLDRTLPYKSARRVLALESSEDYEALVLRLISGEGNLVTTDPGEAGDIARTVMAAKVPDLTVLDNLRQATIAFTDEAIARLDGVRPLPPSAPPVREAEAAAPALVAEAEDDHVIPIRRAPEPAVSTATARREAPAGRTPDFLTEVSFTPPIGGCWACGVALPDGRVVNFCVECGADQRMPQCPSCHATVERQWKHCPECGMVLARS
jgi:hypothetical protein